MPPPGAPILFIFDVFIDGSLVFVGVRSSLRWGVTFESIAWPIDTYGSRATSSGIRPSIREDSVSAKIPNSSSNSSPARIS